MQLEEGRSPAAEPWGFSTLEVREMRRHQVQETEEESERQEENQEKVILEAP